METIKKEVDKLVEDNFVVAKDYTGDWGDTYFEETKKKGPLTFKTTVTVFGKPFENLEDAKAFTKERALEILEKLVNNRPFIYLTEKDDGVTPVLDGWPGWKHPTEKGWEKIYNILAREYGPDTRDVVENYVKKRTHTIANGVPFNRVLNITFKGD